LGDGRVGAVRECRDWASGRVVCTAEEEGVGRGGEGRGKRNEGH